MPRAFPLLATAIVALAGCRHDDFVYPAYSRVAFVTFGLEGTPGWELNDSVEVRILTPDGGRVPGVWVHWSAPTAGALLSADSSITGNDGIARVSYVPGWALGDQRIEATADGELARMTVQATGMAFSQVEVLDRRTCGLDHDGRMWCWPIYSNESHPMRLDDARRPIPVATSLRFVTLRANYEVQNGNVGMCAITADGQLWCARPEDFAGPSLTTSVVPTLQRVETPGPVVDIGIGGNGGAYRCILDTADAAWCAGPNLYGQLGDGTTTASETWQPVQGDHRFTAITVGDREACAIDLSGGPWCWGGNSNERLGVSPGVFALVTPTPIDGDIRLSRISHAASGFCGIAANGAPTLLCWGPIHIAERTDDTAPSGLVDIPATATSLAGDEFGGRIVHDGRLYRFGYNGGTIADFEFRGANILEPTVTGIVRLVSRSYYWCVEHDGGATICSERFDRPVAVPTPMEG